MKTVVVTGASRGLGLAIAARLARDGYRVVGLSRTLSEGFQALIDGDPGSIVYRQLDISDIPAISGIARAVVKEHGPIYGLVNNAGASVDGVLATMHQSDIERVIATNLIGPITLTKFVLRSMLAKGEGRIVNISSIGASTGYHGLSVYAASKAGLEGFTRALAREAGKRRVTVNCVAPGYMATEMTAGLSGARLESVLRRSPLGPPKPEQVAASVAYLLHEDAASVTGAVLTVDGGSSA